MIKASLLLFLFVLLIICQPVFGQKESNSKSEPVLQPGNNLSRTEPLALTQTGDPALDLAIRELYGVISGPAGQKRDWEKFRSMFAPGARMGVTSVSKAGEAIFRPFTPEDYIVMSGPFLEEQGFFEKEISHKTERYGNLVHVWSTYEAREKESDAKPLMRGINSIQFVKTGNRYKIASLIWQQETTEMPVPAHYLPSGK